MKRNLECRSILASSLLSCPVALINCLHFSHHSHFELHVHFPLELWGSNSLFIFIIYLLA